LWLTLKVPDFAEAQHELESQMLWGCCVGVCHPTNEWTWLTPSSKTSNVTILPHGWATFDNARSLIFRIRWHSVTYPFYTLLSSSDWWD
jgi:hypothetical protein